MEPTVVLVGAFGGILWPWAVVVVVARVVVVRPSIRSLVGPVTAALGPVAPNRKGFRCAITCAMGIGSGIEAPPPPLARPT